MKKLPVVALSVLLAFAFVSLVTASADVTLTGSIMCAKCTLKKADAKECQDVLVVAEKSAKKEYYITKNAVLEQFGHTCTGEKAAVVTGQVSEKDGKTWITATKIEPKK